MSRNKYPEETVKKILEVSQKLFLEKGYEQTSILDIVDQMGGLTRGAFYHHFKSKEDVLNALGDKMFYEDDFFNDVRNDPNLNGLQKIKKIVKLQYQNHDQMNINVMGITFMKNPRVLVDFIQSNQRVIVPLIEGLLTEGMNDGSIVKLKYPRNVAEIFVFMGNTWLIPALYPSTKEEIWSKFNFLREYLDQISLPIIDEDIMLSIKDLVDHVTIYK